MRPFLVMLFGSALLALAAGVVAAARWRAPGSGYLLAGAVLAVLAVLVTIAVNVPLNDQLDALDVGTLSAADAVRDWSSLPEHLDHGQSRASRGSLARIGATARRRAATARRSLAGWREPARR